MYSQSGEGLVSNLNGASSYVQTEEIQQIFAYAKQGETITIEYKQIGNNNFHGIVSWFAPDGTSGSFPNFNYTSGQQTQTLSVSTAAKEGVWKIEMTRDLSVPGQIYGWQSGTDNGRVKWDIGVKNAGVLQSGRIYAEFIYLYNGPNATSSTYSGLIDLAYIFPMAETGHVFEFELHDYMGYYSTLVFDKTGVNDGSCTPLYESRNQVSPYTQANCGDFYRMYFNEPDINMPPTAKFWDGTTQWLKPIKQETSISFVDYFMQDCSGNYQDMYFEVDVEGTAGFEYNGSITIEIDTDGNGVYGEPIDITIQYPYSTAGMYYVPWDGLDGNGNVVTSENLIAHISVNSAIAFFAMKDIEGLGGINAYDAETGNPIKMYWNDLEVDPTGKTNTTPVLDGRNGFMSGTGPGPGGSLHGWDQANSSWGNATYIENWVTLGASPQNQMIELYHCVDPCDPALSGSLDTDLDGLTNKCDLDDDNDGIVDFDEIDCAIGTEITFDSPVGSLTGSSIANFSTANGITGTIQTSFPNGGAIPSAPIYEQDADGIGITTIDDNPAGVSGIITEITFSEPVFVFDFDVKNLSSVHFGYVESQYIHFYNGTILEEFVPEILGSNGGVVYNGKYNPTTGEARGGNTDLGDEANFEFSLAIKVDKITIEQSEKSNFDDIGFKFNRVCKEIYSDTDGTPDHIDIDSDNDHCNDAVEAGHIDANNDGVLDGTGIDPNTGQISGYDTGYTGNTAAVKDPLDNVACRNAAASGWDDNDNDGVSDEFDLDDDNDGILDSEEGQCISIFQNAGFESPALNCPAATPTYSILPDSFVPGWHSTSLPGVRYECGGNTGLSDGVLEIWETGFSGVFANEGNQFAEINGNNTGRLHQFITVPSAGNYILEYEFAHRGRAGDDTMHFGIVENNVFVNHEIFTTGNTAWGEYFGSMTFTASSTNPIEIGFEAISTASGSNGSGNFIDAVDICISRDDDGDGIPNYLDNDSDNDGCPDTVEAGHTDFNGDGVLDGTGIDPTTGLVTGYDTGYTGNQTAVNDPNDNLACRIAAQSGWKDHDQDGIADYFDLDDDNDGILDTVECPQSSNLDDYVRITPDMLGVSPIPSVAPINIPPTDISAEFGLSTGSVILEVQNVFIPSGTSFSTENSSTPQFIVSGSYPMFKGIRHGPFIPAGDTDGIVIENTNYYQFIGDLSGTTLIYENLGNTLQVRNPDSANDQNPGGDNVAWISNRFEGNTVEAFGVSSFLRFYLQPACDIDGDGVPNHMDLDSDNDGCPDINEAGVFHYIQDQNLSVVTNTVASNSTNGIVAGTSIENAQIDLTNAGDTAGGISNGFHDALESSTAGSYDASYLDLTTYYADPSKVNCVCYKSPSTEAADQTMVAISTLNRSVSQSNNQWPYEIKSAILAIESKEKGFVITRLSTAEINLLIAIEGMLVFDTDENCLKMYDGNSWFCLTQGCID